MATCRYPRRINPTMSDASDVQLARCSAAKAEQMEEHQTMPLSLKRHLSTSLLSLGLIASMALASCGSTSNNGGGGPTSAAKGCKKIGVLLPESASSARWESKDHPLLVSAIQ